MKVVRDIVTLAAISLVAMASAQAETRVSIGTGGTGGVFYTVGAGMADVFTKKLTGVTANAEVTGASVENIKRVSAGEMTMGFSSASTLYAAKMGLPPFKSKMNVAGIAYLYPAVLQVAATSKSNAKSVEDLKDLRVSVGPPGSNSAVLAERLLKASGALNPGNIQFLSYSEATNAIKNGNLDASFVLAGVPAGALVELTSTTGAKLVAVNPEKAKSLIAEYPYYRLVDIRGGAYKGNDAPVKAIGDPAVLFTAADADQNLIFNVTKTLFDNLTDVAAVHPAAKLISKDLAADTPIDLHPGAEKYFKGK